MTSEAQKRATKNYKKRNPEKNRIYHYRSTARGFLKNYATLKDLDEMQALLDARRQKLLTDNKTN